MSELEKLGMVKTMLGIMGNEDDEVISAYLKSAEREILGWRYSYASDTPAAVPPEYEMTQVHAVVYGYGQRGAEGETTHTENGVSRVFVYSDMVEYIRRNVIPMVGVMA